MNQAILFNFLVDKESKKIKVERSFQAPIDLVWAAWTESEILDQWWAPKPWRTETKSMDFKEGGRWLYAMVGPEGEKHWCLFDYKSIVPFKMFSGLDAFCDEQANISNDKPRCLWENVFSNYGDSTNVNVEISFDELADLEALIQMGFREGFTMGLENLDQYIQAQFYLRKQNKPGNRMRVATYVNFPGNTTAASRISTALTGWLTSPQQKASSEVINLSNQPTMTPSNPSKRNTILFWVFTGLFSAFMLMSTIPNILSAPEWVEIFNQLGYPLYMLPFIGVAKLLGIIALIVPGFPRIKEWAYAGLFFDLTGAVYSGLMVGGFQPPMLIMLVPYGLLALSYVYHHKRLRAN